MTRRRAKRQIAAKPTTYRGTTFRSRLEARHAIFYDELRIAWEYEAETFTRRSLGNYTPDFRISVACDYIGGPNYKLFVEVKPIYPTPEYVRGLVRWQTLKIPTGIVLAVGGFWKAKVPDFYDPEDEGGLDLHTLLDRRRKTVERAVLAASRYRFDI